MSQGQWGTSITGVYQQGGTKPTGYSTQQPITHGNITVIRPAANLTVKSVDQITLTPDTPRERALEVTGTGAANGRWYSNESNSKINFVDRQGVAWNKGVTRLVMSMM